MNDAFAVGVGDGLAHLLEDVEEAGQFVRRVRPFGEEFGERAALDQLHREEGSAVGQGAEFVNRHDERVLQLAGNLRLFDEAAHEIGPAAVMVEQHLDGQVAIENTIPAAQHRPHAAAADLLDEVVGAKSIGSAVGWTKRRREAVESILVSEEGPHALGEMRMPYEKRVPIRDFAAIDGDEIVGQDGAQFAVVTGVIGFRPIRGHKSLRFRQEVA